ncbi:MAG: aminopeptidase P family protein [Candidatus Atribacteria bacterium]|nr:aminopeptidase P family protein [Candidatus Atribacteria bacterium]
MIEQRTKKLWEEIEKSGKELSLFLVTNPKNVFYLSGFTGEGILLSTPGKNYLITDSRYTEQANQEAKNCQIITQNSKMRDAQTETIRELVNQLGTKVIGYEPESLQVSSYLKYISLMKEMEFYPLHELIEKMRMLKDSAEIEVMKKSAQIATDSFRQTMSFLKEGISELAIAAQLNYNMRINGAKKEAFDLIVTSGERGIFIHGRPTEKKINQNELIIIDFGCIYEMYHSDCTRSVLLGTPSQEQKKIFEVIKQTQIETLGKVKAGQKCCDLDRFARDLIGESGYGSYFSHSLGHGVGLDIHEMPYLSPYDQTVLKPGMVVTIEPGIYIPHIGGVRIEDTVVVTEDGCQILTQLPKELTVSNYLDE